MEEETLSVISIFAIVISLVALIGVSVVYSTLPQEESNPVTWGAIDQYNARITVIQEDIAELKQDAKNFNFNYDDERLDDIDEDIEDVEDDIDDIEDCLKKSNYTEFRSCVR